MSSARRHAVYLYLLTQCCSLDERDALAIERVWGFPLDEARDEMIRSAPSQAGLAIITPAIAETFDFDLRGVPGFFFGQGLTQYDALAQLVGLRPLCPTEYAWRLNLQTGGKLMKPYFDARGRIGGIFIFSHPRDTRPRLLSSAGLCLGTPAVPPSSQTDRSLAA